MDIYNGLVSGANAELCTIRTVDMHTSGEPTRIVVSGYPALEGRTLLEKRAYAHEHLDHVRKRLMWEPRGHGEMYGAILVQETEFTESGEADIGVLFTHNEGYSTMCGHATIALGRFLVDTQDERVFPRRGHLEHDGEKEETTLRLHAPCGVVVVTVPTVDGAEGTKRSDSRRRVRFVSVPSFVSARDVVVEVAEDKRWAALREGGRTTVRVDVAYGGAYYAFVSAEELGFPRGLRGGGGYALRDLDEATAVLKTLVAGRPELVEHPTERRLQYLYGVIVTDGPPDEPRSDSGLTVCFFADQQIDRSPTGSGVSARVALAVAAGKMRVGEGGDFHSVVSLADAGSAFVGTAVGTELVAGRDGGRRWDAVRVAVEGRGFYTGAHAFVGEAEDRVAGAGLMVRLPDRDIRP